MIHRLPPRAAVATYALGWLLVASFQPAAAQSLHDLVDRVHAIEPGDVTVAGKTARHAGLVTRLTDPFTGVAVAARSTASEIAAEVRFREGGAWGSWMPMHVVRSATSDAFVAGYRSDAVRTDDRFEVRIGVPEGETVVLDEAGTFDNRLDVDRQPPPDGLAPLETATSGTIIPPPLITRAEWGAEPFRGTPSRLANPGYEFMTFHHAAGYSAETREEGIAQMKAIQDLHQNIRGWSDIGYQFLVDRGGRLYQGRPFLTAASSLEDLPVLALGAHVGGANTGNIGVSLLGCYHPAEGPQCRQEITPAAYDTYVTLFAFLTERYGVPAGRIRGHRDFSATACPGDNNYVLLPQIDTDMRQLLLTGNASLGDVAMTGAPTREGVIMLGLTLVEDRGIATFRLERWIDGERTVLFDGLDFLPASWADDGVLTEGEVEYRLVALGSDERSQSLASLSLNLDDPRGFVLSEAFPNPTPDRLRVRYFLREPGTVTLSLYDATGRRLRELAEGFHEADTWYLAETSTDHLAGGVYFYRIRVDGFSGNAFDATRPIVVLR